MDWDDMLPAHIAAEQRAYERRQWARRSRALGVSQVDASKYLGVSQARIGQMIHHREQKGSPLERFLNDGSVEEAVRKLSWMFWNKNVRPEV
jgi:predicted transcriptional regulator